MARQPIYSRSPARATGPAPATAAQPSAAATNPSPSPDDAKPLPRRTLRQRLLQHERWLWATGLVLAMLVAGWPAWTGKVQRPLGFDQIDAALRESIAKEPLQAAGLAAYQAILPSVVRVVGEPPAAAAAPGKKAGKTGKALAPDSDDADPHEGRSVGTGVVIVDKGLILTNLHVVEGAARITVTFADGSQSEAKVVNLMRDSDLAVLQALTIPDDLHAATMRSTAGLAPGEAVMAVGFPFGIGPSASQGVVSGLKREFRGQAHPQQPDPVRRGRQPGEFRRAADHHGRPCGGHRHRHHEPQRPAHLHRHRFCCAHRERRRRCRPATLLTPPAQPCPTLPSSLPRPPS